MNQAIGNDVVAALERFEASLAAFTSGLTEIEGSPSYLMLMDATGIGETARKYGATAREAKDLWAFIDAAGSQLTAARAHVNTKGVAGKDGIELRRLLQEPWFAVTLTGASPRSYSVSQTMAEIRRRYEAIRSAVSDIDQLWVSVLPRVEAARATLERLQGEARDLGVLEPLIGRALALAEDLSERLVSDPASVSVQDGSNLDIQVANAAKQMSALRTGHDNLDADFSATEELLASLRVLLARAEASRVESLTKVSDAPGLVRVPSASVLDGPDGLAKRLDELFENSMTRAWTQKRSLLDAWLVSARKLEAQLMRAADSNRKPLEVREEMRGRLRAYTAKIAAMGRAEDLLLADLVDKARMELYNAPTDIPAAEAAITELAARLRA